MAGLCARWRLPWVLGLVTLYLLSVPVQVNTVSHRYWDYIVVGAGPGGLQSAYYLQQANRNYAVLERANVSGSFFTLYPRHDKLISINKRHTGKTNKEFNLRHDWNSLISHDESLLLRHYSSEFFPHRQTLVDYLNDYEAKLGLNVLHNVEVTDLHRQLNTTADQQQFVMSDQKGNIYTSKYLILATGLGTPNMPEFGGWEHVEGYETISTDPQDFEGQTVLILGRGNTAFEVADRIYGSTNLVHMIGRSRVRLSWATHYVGDLRAVNNGLLDTYQLKSLDGVLEGPIEEVRVIKKGGKLYLDLEALNDLTNSDHDMFDNFALREPYDRIIRCLGFNFDDSLFNKDMQLTRGKHRLGKYPRISHNYESTDVEDLYIAGTASHSLDHRKSAGGFIHGFRYTARALHRLLEWRNHQVAWPSVTLPIDNLLNSVLKRINEASGIYQMFQMLGDVIAFRNDKTEFEYFEEFPINLIHEFPHHSGKDVDEVIVMVLEYGANFSGPGKDIFRLDRSTGEPSEAHTSNFLHPVFYHYKVLPSAADMESRRSWQTLPTPEHAHHIVEDFLTSFDAPGSHILPLRRFIERVVDTDMRARPADDCFTLSLTHTQLPYYCATAYLAGQGLVPGEATATAGAGATVDWSDLIAQTLH